MSKKRMLAVLETYEVGSFKKEFVDRIKCSKKKKKKKKKKKNREIMLKNGH